MGCEKSAKQGKNPAGRAYSSSRALYHHLPRPTTSENASSPDRGLHAPLVVVQAGPVWEGEVTQKAPPEEEEEEGRGLHGLLQDTAPHCQSAVGKPIIIQSNKNELQLDELEGYNMSMDYFLGSFLGSLDGPSGRSSNSCNFLGEANYCSYRLKELLPLFYLR